MTSHRFDIDSDPPVQLSAMRKAVRHSPPLPARKPKDLRPPKSKAGAHLIGSHVAPKLIKMQSLGQLPQPEEEVELQEIIVPVQESAISPCSEMTSAGSSGFDPSGGSADCVAVCSPRHNSGSILRPSCGVKCESHKKVAFLPAEESDEEPVNEDLETAVIIRKSEAHRKKKAKPARRAIMSYHANCS